MSDPSATPEALVRGSGLGRYVVLSLLGKGGMGEVYAAYDPDLDRRVAVKVLPADASGEPAEQTSAQERLLREAQAMARLAHPNVVAVHDVGTFEGRVFMAMELVDGQSLRAWLTAAPRTVPEIVRVFVAAGQGLAAAHAAGLVHRDFKPDNVLVGREGAVKVTDFGLARAAESDPEAATESEELSADEVSTGSSRRDRLSAPLTAAGRIMGTAPYVAPEQFRHAPASPLTDQFSFCVSLYEALHRRRPYKVAQLRKLARGDSSIAPPANETGVPAWLQRLVLKGLSADPADRFGSFAELLTALQRDPVARRRKRTAVAGALVATAALAFLAARGPTQQVCTSGPERFSAAWGQARQERVRARFAQLAPDSGATAFDRTAAALADYAEGWAAMHADACRSHQRGEQTAELLALRMGCLDRRLDAVDALGGLFEEADAVLAGKGVEAVASLRTVSGCADVEALTAPIAPPEDPQVRARVEAFRAELSRGQALLAGGQLKAGLELARRVADEAKAIGYRPLEAEAFHLLGWFHQRLRESGPAEQARYDAFVAASAGNHLEVAVQATTELIAISGYELRRFDQGELWARTAAALLERLGGSEELEGKLANNRGILAYAEGRLTSAIEHYGRALRLREKVHGPQHLETSKTMVNLGLAQLERGRTAEALPLLERAVAQIEAALEPDNPMIAVAQSNLARALVIANRPLEAEPLYGRALELRARTLGWKHPSTWRVLEEQALMDFVAGDPGKARERLLSAIELAEAAFGKEHPEVGPSLERLGELHERLGQHPEALAQFRRVHRLYERAWGRADNGTTHVAEAIARNLLRSGRAAEAQALLEQTLVHEEGTMGADAPGVASCVRLLGEAELARGRVAIALPLLERAEAAVAKLDWAPVKLAEFQFALARGLVEAGKDQPRAIALLDAAQRSLAAGGRLWSADYGRLQAWRGTQDLSAPVTQR